MSKSNIYLSVSKHTSIWTSFSVFTLIIVFAILLELLLYLVIAQLSFDLREAHMHTFLVVTKTNETTA
jgi:hypothetical protein